MPSETTLCPKCGNAMRPVLDRKGGFTCTSLRCTGYGVRQPVSAAPRREPTPGRCQPLDDNCAQAGTTPTCGAQANLPSTPDTPWTCDDCGATGVGQDSAGRHFLATRHPFQRASAPSSGEATGGEPRVLNLCATCARVGGYQSEHRVDIGVWQMACSECGAYRTCRAYRSHYTPSPASAGAAPGRPVSNAEELPAPSVSGTGEGEEPELLRRIAAMLERVDWEGGSWGQSAIEDAADTIATLRRRLSELEAERAHAREIVETVRAAVEGTEFNVPGLRLSKLAAHAIRQAVSRQKALATAERRIGELDAERERWVEAEAACCPEDVGFAEYIPALERQLADSRRQLQAVQQEVEKARERLGHGVGANMGKITHEVYEPWCPRCILDRAAARVHPQEGASRGAAS